MNAYMDAPTHTAKSCRVSLGVLSLLVHKCILKIVPINTVFYNFHMSRKISLIQNNNDVVFVKDFYLSFCHD